MNRPIIHGLLSRAIAAAALIGIAMTAVAAHASGGSLEVEVSLEGKASLAGETQFMVLLRNTGDRSIDLGARPGWDRDGGLEMRITQVNGPTQALPVQLDESTRSTVRATGRTAMLLHAGSSIGVFRSFKTAEVIKAAGKYRVVVVHRGQGNQEVASEPLEFTVVP